MKNYITSNLSCGALVRRIARRRMTHLAILLLLFAVDAHAIEAGEDCNNKQKLPNGFLCHEGSVIDCANPGPRVDYLVCHGDQLNKLDAELNKKYQKILKSYDKPNTEDADYKNAKATLIKAQRLWLKFREQDCDMPMYLNLTGTAQSPMMVDCAITHTKKRIEDFDSGFYE